MAKSKEYLAFKNYLHNELKISNEEAREIALRALKDEAASGAKRVIQKMGDNFQKVVEQAILNTTVSILNGKSGSYT